MTAALLTPDQLLGTACPPPRTCARDALAAQVAQLLAARAAGAVPVQRQAAVDEPVEAQDRAEAAPEPEPSEPPVEVVEQPQRSASRTLTVLPSRPGRRLGSR